MTQEQTSQDLFEQIQEKKLSQLYPPFAAIIRPFVAEAKARGMDVAIFEGLRSFERQAALYNQGRDAQGNIVDKKKVVTNCHAGYSFHNYGLACDVVFNGHPTEPGWQWSWDNKWPWKELADLGRGYGLESAYYWKIFPECPHFQLTYGLKASELLSLYKEGGLELVWQRIPKTT